MTVEDLKPSCEQDVVNLVTQAIEDGAPLRIKGGGTRQGLGRASQQARTLDMSSISGITLYEPSEMVIGAWAGTSVAEVQKTLDAKGQMLTFEPVDHRVLLGTDGEPTIGAVVAGNISGPRRLYGGAARDSLIGVRFVNGRGELVKNGGRVMKNVTGLDLVKLQAGAWGTLGVLTEVIFKVLPKPELVQTLVLENLDDKVGVDALCAACGTPYEVTGAAHLPASDNQSSRTLMRIEGLENSVRYRAGELATAMSHFGETYMIEGDVQSELWQQVCDCEILAEPREKAVWKVSVQPTNGPKFVERVKSEFSINHYYDWSGGLVWLSVDAQSNGDAGAELIHKTAQDLGGHAMLVRGNEELRSRIAVFSPQPAPIAHLSAGIKNSFDPDHLINPGLMVAEG